MILAGVSKSGSPISICTMSRPCASRARAFTSTSNAVSVPSLPIRSANFMFSSLRESMFWQKARLTRQPRKDSVLFGLRTPDALHVATAMESDAQVFVTSDRSKRKVSQLDIVMLDDYASGDIPSRS